MCCYEIAGSRQEVVYEIVAVTSNASVMLIDFPSHATVDLILLFTRSIYAASFINITRVCLSKIMPSLTLVIRGRLEVMLVLRAFVSVSLGTYWCIVSGSGACVFDRKSGLLHEVFGRSCLALRNPWGNSSRWGDQINLSERGGSNRVFFSSGCLIIWYQITTLLKCYWVDGMTVCLY